MQQYQQVKLQEVVKQKVMEKEYPVTQPLMRARRVLQSVIGLCHSRTLILYDLSLSYLPSHMSG
jgi:hypothetical protein